MSHPFIHEARISWEKDPYAMATCEWLGSQKYRQDRDWIIDMHGGRETYTSFWFKDLNKALLTKLIMG